MLKYQFYRFMYDLIFGNLRKYFSVTGNLERVNST
jgi:hypothetical protein